jgi:hypothetical protein
MQRLPLPPEQSRCASTTLHRVHAAHSLQIESDSTRRTIITEENLGTWISETLDFESDCAHLSQSLHLRRGDQVWTSLRLMGLDMVKSQAPICTFYISI